MHIEGSCRCGKVRFSCDAYAPVPYMHCYCSICRKTAGGGGYAINLGAHARSLKVKGKTNLRVFRARIEHDGKLVLSSARRSFCRYCGSFLWAYDPSWPKLVHPFASAIDTPLPKAPERVHIMLAFKSPWCEVPRGRRDRHFQGYPDESLAQWHKRHGLLA